MAPGAARAAETDRPRHLDQMRIERLGTQTQGEQDGAPGMAEGQTRGYLGAMSAAVRGGQTPASERTRSTTARPRPSWRRTRSGERRSV